MIKKLKKYTKRDIIYHLYLNIKLNYIILNYQSKKKLLRRKMKNILKNIKKNKDFFYNDHNENFILKLYKILKKK